MNRIEEISEQIALLEKEREEILAQSLVEYSEFETEFLKEVKFRFGDLIDDYQRLSFYSDVPNFWGDFPNSSRRRICLELSDYESNMFYSYQVSLLQKESKVFEATILIDSDSEIKITIDNPKELVEYVVEEIIKSQDNFIKAEKKKLKTLKARLYNQNN